MPSMEQWDKLYTHSMMGLVLLAGVIVVLRNWIRKRRGWTGDPAMPTYGTIGIAALALQQILEPQKAHILEVKQKEEKEEDDEGGPDRAGRRRKRRRYRSRTRRRRQP